MKVFYCCVCTWAHSVQRNYFENLAGSVLS